MDTRRAGWVEGWIGEGGMGGWGQRWELEGGEWEEDMNGGDERRGLAGMMEKGYIGKLSTTYPNSAPVLVQPPGSCRRCH